MSKTKEPGKTLYHTLAGATELTWFDPLELNKLVPLAESLG